MTNCLSRLLAPDRITGNIRNGFTVCFQDEAGNVTHTFTNLTRTMMTRGASESYRMMLMFILYSRYVGEPCIGKYMLISRLA
ncbi:hypothetical protein D3C73_1538550 [compost metagenome]